MKIQTLYKILQSGEEPIVRFGAKFGESIDCCDAVPKQGMVAKIARFFDKDGSLTCIFDLSIAREHNISLMDDDSHLLDEDQSKRFRKVYGNPLEAGRLEGDLIDSYYFDLSEDADYPMEVVNESSPLYSYLSYLKEPSVDPKTYIEWLELQWDINDSRKILGEI